jgi:hypothetical protein
MYSEKKTISMRQTYRLFVFDFLGISTLLLPAGLAGIAGVYGGISILAAWALGTVYLCYLIWCRKRMGTDLVTFLSECAPNVMSKRMCSFPKQWRNPAKRARGITKRLLGLLLALLHTAAAGFMGAVIASMVRQSLIREESYTLILLLVFLVALYAVAGDIQSRARVYEILFWFVLAPLVLMLLAAAKEVDLTYYVPQKTAEPAAAARSAYAVFACFGAMFAVLLLPQEGGGPDREKLWYRKLRRCVWLAFATAMLILLASYYIMVGTFGEKALSVLPYPVITLMSMIQFQGGFLKRLDAIMLAVWFFALFALFGLNLYYGSLLVQGATAGGSEATKKTAGVTWSHLLVLAAAFLIAELIGCREEARALFIQFFFYIQIPLYLLLPGVFAVMAGRSVKGK